jgi:hypothetical protein
MLLTARLLNCRVHYRSVPKWQADLRCDGASGELADALLVSSCGGGLDDSRGVAPDVVDLLSDNPPFGW